MLPVTNARRRPPGPSRDFLSRRATQRPLTSCAFLLVAFTLIYICCVLVSVFRDHDTPLDAPKVHSFEHKNAGQVHGNDVELPEKDSAQHELPLPTHQPSLLERFQVPLKRRQEARIIQPDRARAHSLEYDVCPASSYSVPSYGPLVLIQRGASTACAAYLYAAPFARTTPLLPVLPGLSDPRPTPPHAQQSSFQPEVVSLDDAGAETQPKPNTPSVEKLLSHPIMHHFKDPVLSPEQRGLTAPTLPDTDTTADVGVLEDEDDEVQSIGDDDQTIGDNNGGDGDVETDPNEDHVVSVDEQDLHGDTGVSTEKVVTVNGGDQSSGEAQSGDTDTSVTTATESQQRRLLLEDAARIEINSTAKARSQQAVQLLGDSDQATGVFAAAIMLAAEEMQTASADLEPYTTLHTPLATASLPEDIGRWSHIQLDRAVKLQAAWRTGNTTGLDFPHALALLNHPSRAALAQSFASTASCVLQRLGGPAKDSPAAHFTPEQATESVVTWPQYLSYESAESMPTGRETSMPGALMRGVFVAHANGSVIMDLFDPRAPLDSEEVQDTVPELYRMELRTGDLALMPPWILASIVTVPPLQPPSTQQREPPTMHEHVRKASAASRYLGFHPSVTLENFQPPPHSSHAAILHLALPGEPSLTAGSILPMHMGPLRPPPLSELQHTQDRQLLDVDVYDSGAHDVEDTSGDGFDDVDTVTDADSNSINTDDRGLETEWADQERLQQPGHDTPITAPKTLASPKVWHAPQLTELLQGQAEEVTAHEDPFPGQGSEDGIDQQLPDPDALRGSNLSSEPGGGSQPREPSREGGKATTTKEDQQAQGQEDMCTDVDRIWFSFGSPVSVYSLPEVDPQLDVHALRSLALTAFEAFKNCLPNKGEEFNRESPGSLGDELFEWQSRWPDAASSPCNGGNPGQNSAQLEREWRTAFSAYVGSDEHDRMLRAVATVVVSMLKRMGKDDLADDKDPGIFSWLTVHDASMSYHGRHYHRNQALTAVLYLELPYESAPLEFSNPIEGPDSQPNGRTVFVPTIGDFVLFPSYLSHTVPMRLLKDKMQPRISVAFNIWFEGVGLDRFAEGLAEDERDNIGKHQYFAVSDVTLDRHFLPREGLDLSIERDDHIL